MKMAIRVIVCQFCGHENRFTVSIYNRAKKHGHAIHCQACKQQIRTF